MDVPGPRRRTVGLLAGLSTLLLTVPAPSDGLLPTFDDEQRLESAILDHARSGTIKGRLVDVGEFDDFADVCPTSPDGWDDELTDEEREELIAKGEELFYSTDAFAQQPSLGPTVFDERLACVSCHPAPGRSDGRLHLVGPTEHRDLVPRHTPHLLRIGEAAPYGWDGRFECLQAVIKNAIVSPLELHAAQEPTQEQLDALAAFVDTLDVPDAVPGVDYDPDLAAQGELLFAQYRGIDLDGEDPVFDGISCLHCHQGPDGTDNSFHRILLPAPLVPLALDPGHIDDDGNIRGFKTPVLRGVRHTAPYFHDGSMGDPTGRATPYMNDPPIGALLVMMEAYRARFAFDFTPEEQLALVHYMLSR